MHCLSHPLLYSTPDRNVISWPDSSLVMVLRHAVFWLTEHVRSVVVYRRLNPKKEWSMFLNDMGESSASRNHPPPQLLFRAGYKAKGRGRVWDTLKNANQGARRETFPESFQWEKHIIMSNNKTHHGSQLIFPTYGTCPIDVFWPEKRKSLCLHTNLENMKINSSRHSARTSEQCPSIF